MQNKELTVRLDLENQSFEVGQLIWEASKQAAVFIYHPDFLQLGLPISPYTLTGTDYAITANCKDFENLHGVFNDSLPDGWGRYLFDRNLKQNGIDMRHITPLDRLAAIGTTGVGALTYHPPRESIETLCKPLDLAWVHQEIEKTLQHIPETQIETLLSYEGGSAGARPKIMIGYNQQDKTVISDCGSKLPDGYTHWLVKFASQYDHPHIGLEEYAYSLMAKAAGIIMADTCLIKTSTDQKLFATKRFDRTENGRIHMHTACGLLEASHRYPSLSYKDLFNLTRNLTRCEADCRQIYRRMVFNVLARNMDDHSKNHAFLMDRDGNWSLSPAYDLTHSVSANEHAMDVNGQGKDITKQDMLAIASHAGLNQQDAENEIEQVLQAINRSAEFVEQAFQSTPP